MKRTTLWIFPLLMVFSFLSCSNDKKSENNNGTGVREQSEIIQQVSLYSDSMTIAATYYNADTNWTELAKALWKEKTRLMAGKDSSVNYYLIVFNELSRTPDIKSDFNIAWNQDYNTYRSCTIDNGLGFARFCFGIRYDIGRLGDWAHIRYVNPDGSLTEEQ